METVEANKEKDKIVKELGKDFKFKEIREFLCEASLHGVRLLALKNINIFRRLFWLICILTASVYFIINFSQSLVDFLEYNSVISESVYRAEPEEGFEFPAITFCPNNAIKKSYIEEIYPELFALNVNQFRALYSYSTVNQTNVTSDPNFREVFRQVGVKVNDTFLYCDYRGQINCSDYIHEITWGSGHCLTFNSDALARHYMSSRPENIRLKQADQAISVSFVLNTMVDEYTLSFGKLHSAFYRCYSIRIENRTK